MLIAIVLISILNVMIMAVYERVREIGTIAAIGTLPGKILSLFLVEGLFLGVAGALVGVWWRLGIYLRSLPLEDHLRLRPSDGLILEPTIAPREVPTALLHGDRRVDRWRACSRPLKLRAWSPSRR